MMNTHKNSIGWVTYAASAALAFGIAAQNTRAAAAFTVVVDGLHSPRGLTFAPGAHLYVAEAGSAPGRNSAIDEVVNWATDHASIRTVASGLPSSGSVGADGISAQGNGTIYAIIGESEESDGPGFGHLIKVNTAGQVRCCQRGQP